MIAYHIFMLVNYERVRPFFDLTLATASPLIDLIEARARPFMDFRVAPPPAAV